jgi:hypothetical protein
MLKMLSRDASDLVIKNLFAINLLCCFEFVIRFEAKRRQISFDFALFRVYLAPNFVDRSIVKYSFLNLCRMKVT